MREGKLPLLRELKLFTLLLGEFDFYVEMTSVFGKSIAWILSEYVVLLFTFQGKT